jgi:hypothetical protein
MIYSTKGEHVNHYTNDAVTKQFTTLKVGMLTTYCTSDAVGQELSLGL